MIPVEFDFLFLIYLSLGLALIIGLWLFYDRREVRPYLKERNRATFFCVKCGHLYTGPRTEEAQACPRCGFANARLKF